MNFINKWLLFFFTALHLDGFSPCGKCQVFGIKVSGLQVFFFLQLYLIESQLHFPILLVYNATTCEGFVSQIVP